MQHATPSLVMVLPLMAVGLTTLAIIGWAIWSVASGWTKARESARQHELKRLMIERGMSVDEIERVLAAGTTTKVAFPQPDETLSPAKPQAGPMKWPVPTNN